VKSLDHKKQIHGKTAAATCGFPGPLKITYAFPLLCLHLLSYRQQALYEFAPDSHSDIKTVTEDIMQVLWFQ